MPWVFRDRKCKILLNEKINDKAIICTFVHGKCLLFSRNLHIFLLTAAGRILTYTVDKYILPNCVGKGVAKNTTPLFNFAFGLFQSPQFVSMT